MYKPVIIKKVVNDEHYYYVDDKFVPSVTKILHEAMPMPIGLKMWLGDVGNEKADQKLNQAAARGTYLHNLCESLLNGVEINLNEVADRKDKKSLVSFVNWFSDFQPNNIEVEQVVASTLGYAGTLDIKCTIEPEFLEKNKIKPQYDTNRWIIDIKTSRSIYTEHKLQVTAYQEAVYEMTGDRCNRAILHLNPLTKLGYKFDNDFTIEDKLITVDDFMTVLNMYKMINGGVIPEPPIMEEYPETLTLMPKKDAEN
jgi:hypothetical protein